MDLRGMRRTAGDRKAREERRRWGESILWRLQHRYFSERGVEAWRQAEVPHYVTSNPTMANAYAEVVLAVLRDRDRIGKDPENEPLTICELGAGSGRFAFHFLTRLSRLCEEARVAPSRFRYVLTDIAERNLEFWRAHPRFRPFFESGILDMARFDATKPGKLELTMSGAALGRGALRAPLVAIANYVFDSVPQDLFRFKDGRAWEGLLSVRLDGDPAELDPGELIDRMEIRHGEAPLNGSAYPEMALQELFDEYRLRFSDTHLLFPAHGLRAISFLRDLSQQGLLLLSADKGEHRIELLEGQEAPGLVRHGSVSLPINYHAFVRVCEAADGLALVPNRRANSVEVVGLLMLPDAEAHSETRRAYALHVGDFGPDGFFGVTKQVCVRIPGMSAREILHFIRLSRNDGHQFARVLPRLSELADELDDATRAELSVTAEAVWALHFPIGEELDLACAIAHLLYALDDYQGALTFFERSTALYGADSGTLYNMACCRHMLGHDEEARAALHLVIRHDPGNDAARELRTACAAA